MGRIFIVFTVVSGLAVIAQQIYYRFFRGQTTDPRFAALGIAVGVLEGAALRVMQTGAY